MLQQSDLDQFEFLHVGYYFSVESLKDFQQSPGNLKLIGIFKEVNSPLTVPMLRELSTKENDEHHYKIPDLKENAHLKNF